MAEKYELNININEGDNSGNNERTNDHQTRPANPRAIARPRHTTRSNGLDFWASLKGQLGDKAYNKAYAKVKEKATAGGKKPNQAGIMADKAGDKAKIKTMYLLNQAQQAIGLGVQTAGEYISLHIGNEAQANMLNNLIGTGNDLVSAGTNIAQGAIAGGGIGAIVAVAMEAYKIACKALIVSESNKKENISRAAESERRLNRLGYIDAGYSR